MLILYYIIYIVILFNRFLIFLKQDKLINKINKKIKLFLYSK